MRRLLLLLLLFPLFSYGQNQEATVLAYNVAFGGITSGVGAAINRPKGVRWEKAFIKGAWQGTIGGLLTYSGKKTLYLINRYENTAYAWPAKLLHAAGTSITENAALGKPFLENWHIDYGVVRLDFATTDKKLRARFLPFSIPAIFWAANGNDFDLPVTLLTGNIAFAQKGFFININGKDFVGVSYGRAFAYVDNYTNNKYATIAHELVHQFQFNECQVFNAWQIPPARKAPRVLQKAFTRYIYADIPYHWSLYYLQGLRDPASYFRNYYEFEAERFSTNNHVER